jgi:hypothetical protein
VAKLAEHLEIAELKGSDVTKITDAHPQMDWQDAYAIQYAGYPSEKRKLSVNVKYRLASRKVDGSTLLTIDQLTLGPKVESPTATKLPVKLVLAILTDSSGKLELDLPMEGDIDSPDYHFGRQFVHTLENVLQKIVSSPLSWLGSAFGSKEDLSFVEFQEGSSQISDAEREKIGKLVTALTERPALRLSITGLSDPASDQQALAKVRLDELLVVHQRGAAARSSAGGVEPLTEKERSAGVHALYEERVVTVREREAEQLEAQGKPVPPDFLPKPDLPVPEMEAALISVMVTADDLSNLARRRAEMVLDELVHNGKLLPERVFVSAAKPESTPKRQAELKLE